MSEHLLVLDTEEREFLRKIFEEYKDDMFYTAYVILENVQDAEDVLQETFLVLLSNVDKMKGNSPQKNWNYIVTIVKNRAINLYNKKKRRVEKELPITDDILGDLLDEDFDKKILEMEQADILAELLAGMNETYRDILLLRYYHDMSCVEIGEIMGMSPDNVRQIVHRARKKLQSMLKARETFKEK